MSKRALVIQHMEVDSPGRFAAFLAADGYSIETVMIGNGEAIPPLVGYDFMVVLGGAMNVWQETEYPWLKEEKAALREWVGARARPYIGLCLGHQLLADAMGGAVGRAVVQEVGIHSVAKTAEADGHPLAAGFPEQATVTQWHHAEVKRLPEGAVNLASSTSTPIQVIAVGSHAIGLQFHAEWTEALIASWDKGARPVAAAYEKELGPGSYARLRQHSRHMMKAYDEIGRAIYHNLMRSTGLPTVT